MFFFRHLGCLKVKESFLSIALLARHMSASLFGEGHRLAASHTVAPSLDGCFSLSKAWHSQLNMCATGYGLHLHPTHMVQ